MNFKKNRVRKAKSKIERWSLLKKHMDKRLLLSSYKHGLYLKITSHSQENLNMEEYIREFEQLQMGAGLNEDLELKITRFIKGLSPNITNKGGL